MKKKLKFEVIVINGKELSFKDFATACQQKGNQKDLPFDSYYAANHKDLKTAWTNIKKAAADGYIKHLEEEQKPLKKLVNKIKSIFKK